MNATTLRLKFLPADNSVHKDIVPEVAVNKTGILLQMKAKPGKQRQVERILKGTKP